VGTVGRSELSPASSRHMTAAVAASVATALAGKRRPGREAHLSRAQQRAGLGDRRWRLRAGGRPCDRGSRGGAWLVPARKRSINSAMVALTPLLSLLAVDEAVRCMTTSPAISGGTRPLSRQPPCRSSCTCPGAGSCTGSALSCRVGAAGERGARRARGRALHG